MIVRNAEPHTELVARKLRLSLLVTHTQPCHYVLIFNVSMCWLKVISVLH